MTTILSALIIIGTLSALSLAVIPALLVLSNRRATQSQAAVAAFLSAGRAG